MSPARARSLTRARSHTRADQPMALADFPDRAGAERLAARLVAEGLGAEVWDAADARPLLPAIAPPAGPTVIVRRDDYSDAVVMTRLFDEVDQGRSRIAPGPRTFWAGPPYRQLIGAGLLVLLGVAVGLLIIAALP